MTESVGSDLPATAPVGERLALRAGDAVEVRSEEEILSLLDAEGRLDALPFMPEMLRFCGKRFRVSSRAHKACDTIAWRTLRRMEDAVHLEELRCDGSAHGGCQAGCLLYWKEAWLKPVERRRRGRAPGSSAGHRRHPRDALRGNHPAGG